MATRVEIAQADYDHKVGLHEDAVHAAAVLGVVRRAAWLELHRAKHVEETG